MDPLFLIIIAIAALVGYRWLRGGKENKMLILATTGAMERTFHPLETRYTNIGGTVGYHFNYELSSPFKRLEGTLTTLPRHTLMYLPISLWLLRREDLLLFTLYCEQLETGTGYIAEQSRYRTGRVSVEDRDGLNETVKQHGDRQFLLLWYNPMIRDRLESIFAGLSDVILDRMLFIGYYGGKSYISFTLNPAYPHLEPALQELNIVFSKLAANNTGW